MKLYALLSTLFLFFFLALSVGLTAQTPEMTSDSTSRDSSDVFPEPMEEDEDVVIIYGRRSYSAAGDQQFRSADFALAPKNSAHDLLRVVPGLIISQHAGGGKAEQIFLRGFDADHGTDVNIAIDDVPINMVSHGHGQGYADLHFIMPETVREIEVMKGPYLAEHGDLATAGAIAIRTIDTLEENLVKVEGGSFGTYRVASLVRATPDDSETHAFFGAEIYGTNGFVEQPQNLDRILFFGKGWHPIGDGGRVGISLSGFSSEWDASGQIPERAVRSGRLTRFGSVDPSEGGSTSRSTVALRYESQSESPLEVSLSATDYRFRLFSNFTFFAGDSVRGDGIEQIDDRTMLAFKAQKSIGSSIGSVPFVGTFGVDIRNDDTRVGLFRSPERERIETVRENAIRQRHIAPYVAQTLYLPWARVYLGLRADYFGFDVENLDAAPGVSGVADAFLLSPKATVAVPISSVTLFFNSGFGFHSNDARAVVEESEGAIPRALGLEVGARAGDADDPISVAACLWSLSLEEEFVFVGDEGTTESSGRTLRRGIDLETIISPIDLLSFGFDATFSWGRFLDEPEGADRIPLAPDLTLTANAVLDLDPVRSLLQLRHISDRPANESNSIVAEGYTLVDLSTTLSLGSFDFSLVVENILDAEWREAQFDTESRLEGEAAPVSEIHFTPGTPRAVRLGVAWHM